MVDKKNKKKSCLADEISAKQATDTGMAMVLIGLLAFLSSHRDLYLIAALGLLLMNMIWPRFYAPVAKIWLGFSAILGGFMTNVVMSLIFITIVYPIAQVRRLTGGDSMQLKKWKASRESVFLERNHTYSTEDIHKPY